ncbi:shikimate kinase [Hyphobacterium sp. HN65]|uniref:Shikimate kinase n=1 Tax=Hyphobacterium lacteum TaxID=3116575 RepID=A0ABU7LR43_9PROT|nr:shikimate kinase [Hyphobacterium sp. HN65]MEE2526059.1 shikimate kinase [Hyphobacterium sp. HN65]
MSEDSASGAADGRPIVLVGLMGAGKTTVGRRLAAALELPFKDADEEIEKAADRPVADIFSDFGEAAFRDGERRVIARLLEEGQAVLALGGGAFVNDETRKLVREKAISIWLKADLDTLMERVSRRDNRPLLRTDNPRAVMAELMAKREAAYAEADIQIEGDQGPHATAVERILEALVPLGFPLKAVND